MHQHVKVLLSIITDNLTSDLAHRTCLCSNSTYTYFLILTEIVCSDVPAIGNGTTTIPTRSDSFNYSLGSVAIYSCNTGYVLVGQTTRVCEDTNGGTMTTGTWSGSAPTCNYNI